VVHLFTYGTLQHPRIWQAVVGRTFPTVAGRLDGHAIHRVRDAVYPGITATQLASSVRGLVHLGVDAGSIATLDRFEDDFYTRIAVRVRCQDGRELDAQAYVILQENRANLSDDAWSIEEFVASGHVETFLARYAGFGRLKSDGAAG
jgi:gamma-glutamylcyclotransferase (GGCT)/AIG2-like uncharacterized protein YtfP